MVLFVATVGLWVYSQSTFTRITIFYGLPNTHPLEDRRITLLAWSNAAQIMIQTEGLQPDEDSTEEQVRAHAKEMMDLQLYQQEGLSTTVGAEWDVARLWGFHYRSPQDAQAMNYSYSTPRAIGTTHYLATIQTERAFFVSWWLLAALLGVLPALVARKWFEHRRRLRMGHCLHCDYNLAGNASGVCPECGTKISG